MSLERNNGGGTSGECWILGCGRFGRQAMEQLRKADPSCRIVVVDLLPAKGLPDDVTFVLADGVSWLLENLHQDAAVSRIIPALPLHLAFQWLKNRLLGEGRDVRLIPIPDELMHRFPHPFRLGPGSVAISHADFLCPPHCQEPGELCSYTGSLRPRPLYDLLGALTFEDWRPLILRSRQFGRGVGGYYPEDLLKLLQRARDLAGKPVLLGTACKCHGIVDGFLQLRE